MTSCCKTKPAATISASPGPRLQDLGSNDFRAARVGGKSKVTIAIDPRGREASATLSPLRLALWLAAYAAALAFYFYIVDGPGRIHFDMTEAYVWGREFALGYHQHPPFWAWICGAWFLAFPREIGWFGLLSAINATLGLYGIWLAIGNFVKAETRIAAFALAFITPCYSFMAFRYNANTIFISLWPFMAHFFMRSIDRGRVVDAFGLGLFAGFALMSKYYAAVLIAACVLAWWTHPRRDRYWRSFSPYLSGAVALALFAPHLAWLATHRAPPLQYLASMSNLDVSAMASFLGWSTLGALKMAAPAAVAVAALARFSPLRIVSAWRERWSDPRFRTLAALALAPAALTFLSAILLRTRLYAEMLVGVFALWPLLCVEIARPADLRKFTRGATLLALAALAGLVVLSAPVSYITAHWSRRARDVQPLRELSLAAEQEWRKTTGAPLVYVAGFDDLEKAAAFYSADRPHAFSDFDYDNSPWVEPAEVAEHGLLSLCLTENMLCLQRAEQWAGLGARRIDFTLVHVAWGFAANPYSYRVTITPPSISLGRP